MPHTIKLRRDVFTKAARLAGYRSVYALARAMDVNRSTVARVLAGELQPGPAFIAGALLALAPMQFHDLFDIVPDQRRSSEGVNLVPQAQDR
ncbi:transcriptional regulator [Actinosynnema sp. NPDC091369]